MFDVFKESVETCQFGDLMLLEESKKKETINIYSFEFDNSLSKNYIGTENELVLVFALGEVPAQYWIDAFIAELKDSIQVGDVLSSKEAAISKIVFSGAYMVLVLDTTIQEKDAEQRVYEWVFTPDAETWMVLKNAVPGATIRAEEIRKTALSRIARVKNAYETHCDMFG